MHIPLDLRAVPKTTDPLTIYEHGALDESDLAVKDLPIAKAPDLERISDRHHLLAMALANGTPIIDCARMYGYSPQRISTLKGDRAFRSLMEHYKGIQAIAFADYQERMATLGVDAMSELHRRLEEDPAKLTNGQLLAILEKMADRTGHSPVQRSQSHHIHENIGERLSSARERLSRMREVEHGIDNTDNNS